jgi:DNA modification methylase
LSALTRKEGVTREYKQILPVRKDVRVVDQFGWLPTSIFKPEKRPELEALVKDTGDPTGATKRSANAKYKPNMKFSTFHPHLAEIVINYWTMPGTHVVDPFAGRSCRGVVTEHLGRTYEGYELAPATVDKLQNDIKGTIHPADGCRMESTPDESADLVFTCPPYHRLEKYEDVPGQLSSIKKYEDFLLKIEETAGSIARVLKPNGFVCWACADWRDGKGFRLFHIDSINAFAKARLQLHDLVVIHNTSPFVYLQAGKVAAKRYTSKTHEYLLVFRSET